MMKKLYLITLPLILLLTSCASLWERAVYERAPHLVAEDIVAETLTANSPETLKNTILGVIRGGERQVDIRVTDYPGDLTSRSLSEMLIEIQTREPIGAYTVEYMAFDLTSILSQHTITLDIGYKHEEPPAVLQVSGRRGLEDAVWAALSEYQSRLVVEMRYYHAQEHDTEEMIQSFYYNNPSWAMERPEVNLSLYPSDGSLHRIVELEMTWSSAEELSQKTEMAEQAALDFLRDMPVFFGDDEEQTAQEVLWLHDTLCEKVVYDHYNYAAMLAAANERQTGDAHTAYGALVNNLANGEGYAMAFKLLCDILEIDSLVVLGRRPGEREVWNLVRIGEEWHHISAALNGRGAVASHEYFLLSDEAAEAFFEWDRNQYPTAKGSPWTHRTIRGLRR